VRGQAGGVGGHVAAAGGGQPFGCVPAAAGATQASVQDLDESSGVAGAGRLHVLHAAWDVGDGITGKKCGIRGGTNAVNGGSGKDEEYLVLGT